MAQGKYRCPAEMGSKGLPPGMKSSSAPKKGLIVPSEMGSKGKPHSHGIPGTKAPRD